nr:hypothetical protein [Tanacetum cinerariifolium]
MSNTLHNAIMEADTKPNHELIHYCLENPPYELGWKDKEVPTSEGSSITRTERFLLQLQAEWQRFVTLVKQSQELKTVSYHKLYDILKQHQHEVNEIRAEKIARVANPPALVAQQQLNSSTRSQQAATRNRGKAIVNSLQPIYDQEPSMVAEDDETSKDKEIDKLMALISLSETVGSTVVHKSVIQCYNYKEFGHVVRECQKPKRAKDAAYHRENMLLCKQEEAGIQLNAEQADWRDDTDDDELKDQELEAHYMYMAQLQEVSPNASDSGPIFDAKPLQKKEAQIKLYKTREDKELEKVIELENKVKVLDNIVYKTGQTVQTMNMLNNKCRTSFAKPEFLKKAQRANPRLYDIGCYNDNLALLLAPDTDEVIRLEKESRSKLSDLIRPFDYDKLNNLYDLFVPQREKSSEQRYFSERSRLSPTNVNNGKSKESFHKQTTLLEKRMDESIQLDKQVIPKTSVSRPQLKSNPKGDRVLRSNSHGNKLEVEEHRRNVKLLKNKMSVTACTDCLNAKTLNVKSVSAMCAKCV